MAIERAAAVLALALAAALLSGCPGESTLTETPANGPGPTNAPASTPAPGADSLLGLIGANGELSAFLDLAESVGMAADFRTTSGLTVLAPHNGAFEELAPGVLERLRADPRALRNVLAAHVAVGTLTTAELRQAASVRTLSQARDRFPVRPAGESLLVGPAAVIKGDLEGGGCLLHVIDRVLQPRPFDPAAPEDPGAIGFWRLPARPSPE
jgi:uncharacterized surface protein with fasciclin (FAS1) repeats